MRELARSPAARLPGCPAAREYIQPGPPAIKYTPPMPMVCLMSLQIIHRRQDAFVA
jgi:hypothetical protein